MNQVLQGSLLLVDDEVPITRALHRALRAPLGNQVNIVTCNSGEDAVGELLARRYDVIVSDLRMPNMGGMELLVMAADIQPGCVRMILTGTADFATAQEAVNKFGLYRYLTKPWDIDELVKHISSALTFSAEQRAQKDQAVQWEASQGQLSAEALERHRLESMEPGITRVEWDATGCVVVPTSWGRLA
jgi:DNA-binding NtrC family response regulator